MKNKIILTILLSFTCLFSYGQVTCPPGQTSQIAKWNFINKQCFQQASKLVYADTSQVAYVDTGGNLVMISWTGLYQKLNINDSIINYLENYQNTLSDSSKFRYCVNGWVPSLVDSSHVAEGGLINIGGDTLVNVYSKNNYQNHYGDSAYLAIRYSFDAGLTWTLDSVLFNSPWDDRNPSVGWVNGKIVVWFIQRETEPDYVLKGLGYIQSSDRGSTWDTFVPFTAIKPGTNSPYGRIIKNPKPGGEWCVFVRSTGWCEVFKTFDGNTWASGGIVYDSTFGIPSSEEPSFEYFAPDSLICLIRDETHSGTYVQGRSFDNLATHLVYQGITNINNGQFGQSPLIYFDSLRRILVTIGSERHNSAYSPFNDKTNIYANSVSEVIDNPLGYSFVSVINRAVPNKQVLYGYPTLTQLNNGNMVVIFTDRNIHPDSTSTSSINEQADLYQFDINYMDESPMSKTCQSRYVGLSPVYNNVNNVSEFKPIVSATYFNPLDSFTTLTYDSKFKLSAIGNSVPILDIRNESNRKQFMFNSMSNTPNLYIYGVTDYVRHSYNNANRYNWRFANYGDSIVDVNNLWGVFNAEQKLINLSGNGVFTFQGYRFKNGVGVLNGSYGTVVLNSTSGYTSGARPIMLSNALTGNKFAIIRGVDANTPPTIGDLGALTSGSITLVADNTGRVGLGGIQSPSQTLDVQGTARISTVPLGTLSDSMLFKNTSGQITKMPSNTFYRNTGLIAGQLVFGAGDGKLAQSSALAYDSAKSRLLVNDINGITDTNKIIINGANFISGGGDEGGAFNGTYSLFIGEQAGNRHVKDSNQTYDVTTALGFGATENSHTSFSVGVGAGAIKDFYGISTTAIGNDAGRNTKSPFDINAYGGHVFVGLNAGRNSDSSSLVTAIGISAGAYNRYSRRSVYVGAGAGANGTLSGRHHFNVTAVGSNAMATESGKSLREAYNYSSYGFENSLWQGGINVNSFGKYGLSNPNPQFFTDVNQIGVYDAVSTSWLPSVVDSSTIIGNNIFPLTKKSFNIPTYQNAGFGKFVDDDSFKVDILGNMRLNGTFSLSNGSSSIPAINFLASGIYQRASGSIGLSFSGADAAYALSQGEITSLSGTGARVRYAGSPSAANTTFGSAGDINTGLTPNNAEGMFMSNNGVVSQTWNSNATTTANVSLVLNPISATAASALTPVAGMMLFVNTTNGTFTSTGFWKYNGTTWSTF